MIEELNNLDDSKTAESSNANVCGGRCLVFRLETKYIRVPSG